MDTANKNKSDNGQLGGAAVIIMSLMVVFAAAVILDLFAPFGIETHASNKLGPLLFAAGILGTINGAIQHKKDAAAILAVGLILSLLAGGLGGLWVKSHPGSQWEIQKTEMQIPAAKN